MPDIRPTYYIPDWHLVFETQSTRRVSYLRFVSVPVKHDGRGYRRIAALPDGRGVGVFCAWSLICQVAAKTPERGILADEQGPLDAEDLAAKTGFPTSIFDDAFLVLTDPRIGWLAIVDPNAMPSNNLSNLMGGRGFRGGEGRGGEERKQVSFHASGVSIKIAPGEDAMLPSWLDLELWKRWCRARRAIKKSLTPLAIEQQLRDLAGWHGEGLDIVQIIETSIASGYQGLFRPRSASPSPSPQSQQRTQRRDISACPDCRGTGVVYPGGFDKGAKPCKHSSLVATENV